MAGGAPKSSEFRPPAASPLSDSSFACHQATMHLTADAFIHKWRAAELKERSAAQEHFIDLCRLLDEPTPADADPTGSFYAFERGASKTTGGEGWADVWKRGHFGWEYKGKRKDLTAAFVQLQQYALALENPPLLVTCDLDRFVIRTNWTNTVSETRELTLDDLRDAGARQVLKWVLSDPEKLRPGVTRQGLTEMAAADFAALAQRLQQRGHDPQEVAHFVNRLVFCMFAEDVNLLPNAMFSRMLTAAAQGSDFQTLATSLFGAMRNGGMVGFERVEWFNGGLFDSDDALPLDPSDVELCRKAAALDWGEIDPSILGTLFERGLDPTKRAQLGAHYTDRDKIMRIVEPVIIRPWLAKWERAKAAMASALNKAGPNAKPSAAARARAAAEGEYRAFLDRLRAHRVLDPACGSGNFLYLALRALKDLEHRAGLEAEALGFQREFPAVGPENVLGLELNPYAAELARVTVWIGEIQWMRRNGFDVPRQPILRALDSISCRDALIDEDGREATWPKAQAIIGNPPFLGGRKLKPSLGDDYVAALRRAYRGRLPEGADLVCYWFDKAAREMISGSTSHVGLVATNSISGGANRQALETASKAGSLYDVWDDEPWTVDGASVRVALVCFAVATLDEERRLNGVAVERILADLTAVGNGQGSDLSAAGQLAANKGLSFQGVVPRSEVNRSEKRARGLPDASFLVPGDLARAMLAMPPNPNGRTNRDVLRRYLIGDEITTRGLDRYIVDFGELLETEAALYEAPFEYIRPVKQHRAAMNQPEALRFWWRHWNSRPKMRAALSGMGRYIATPRVAKHRLFVWVPGDVLPDCQVVAIANDDDAMLGILQSRAHELWTLRMCTFLGVGNDPRYTPSTTFETFPFPSSLLGSEEQPRSKELNDVRDATQRLVELRSRWLHPSDAWPSEETRSPSAPMAEGGDGARTLTNLYNVRPTWLVNAHRDLDAAVARLYGLATDVADDALLRELLALNVAQRAGA